MEPLYQRFLWIICIDRAVSNGNHSHLQSEWVKGKGRRLHLLTSSTQADTLWKTGAPALIPCAVLGIVCCSDLPQPWKRSSPPLLQVMSMNPKGIFHFMPNGTLTMVSFSPGLVLFPEPTTSDECDIKRENSSLGSPGKGEKGLSLLSVGVVEIPVAAMLCPMSSSANFCCHSFKSHAGECSFQ